MSGMWVRLRMTKKIPAVDPVRAYRVTVIALLAMIAYELAHEAEWKRWRARRRDPDLCHGVRMRRGRVW